MNDLLNFHVSAEELYHLYMKGVTVSELSEAFFYSEGQVRSRIRPFKKRDKMVHPAGYVRCGKCKRLRPQILKYFAWIKDTDKFRTTCRECHAITQSQVYEKDKRRFVLKKGDKVLARGTLQSIGLELGIKPESVYKYSQPTWHNITPGGDARRLIRE